MIRIKRDSGLTKLVCVGEHHFSWAILPHEGHFLESDVPVAGYLYNSPLRGMFLASKTRFFSA
jgi:alpha-mannosidase